MRRLYLAAALALCSCTYEPPAQSGLALLPPCAAGETLSTSQERWTCFDPATLTPAFVAHAERANSAARAAHAASSQHADVARLADQLAATSVTLGAGQSSGEALEVLDSRAVTAGAAIAVPLESSTASPGASAATGSVATVASTSVSVPLDGKLTLMAQGSVQGSGSLASPNDCWVGVRVDDVMVGSQEMAAFQDSSSTPTGAASFTLLVTADVSSGTRQISLDLYSATGTCTLAAKASLDVELN